MSEPSREPKGRADVWTEERGACDERRGKTSAAGAPEASGASRASEQGALSDLRVVELGQLLAGPFCGQLLGDFGAEVIKVEDPINGDPMRQWGREKPYGQSLW